MKHIQNLIFSLSLLLLMSVNAFVVPIGESRGQTLSNVSTLSQRRVDEHRQLSIILFATENEETTKEVEVGSKEYLEGFLSSPIQDETIQQRGSGLEQALKLAGSASIILAVLFIGFMASNGLL